MVLGKSGYVWAWGSSDKGQTGSADFEAVNCPSKIECHHSSSVVFKLITAGSYHSVAIASTGEVCVLGDDSFEQLGLGSIEETKELF
jgi:alpha-tubulin suppressor-like RCC1 family protein